MIKNLIIALLKAHKRKMDNQVPECEDFKQISECSKDSDGKELNELELQTDDFMPPIQDTHLDVKQHTYKIENTLTLEVNEEICLSENGLGNADINCVQKEYKSLMEGCGFDENEADAMIKQYGLGQNQMLCIIDFLKLYNNIKAGLRPPNDRKIEFKIKACFDKRYYVSSKIADKA